MEGIYISESKLFNGKQHLKQDSGDYEIIFEGGKWKIENKKLEKGVISHKVNWSLPHEITDWNYLEDGKNPGLPEAQYIKAQARPKPEKSSPGTSLEVSSIHSDVKGLDISVEEDCLPDSDFCQGILTCGDKGICYYPHLIRKECCMKQ